MFTAGDPWRHHRRARHGGRPPPRCPLQMTSRCDGAPAGRPRTPDNVRAADPGGPGRAGGRGSRRGARAGGARRSSDEGSPGWHEAGGSASYRLAGGHGLFRQCARSDRPRRLRWPKRRRVGARAVEQQGFVKGFVNGCVPTTAGEPRRHPAVRGGDATYRLTPEDVASCRSFFYDTASLVGAAGACRAEGMPVDGAFFLVTRAGAFMRMRLGSPRSVLRWERLLTRRSLEQTIDEAATVYAQACGASATGSRAIPDIRGWPGPSSGASSTLEFR